MLINSFHFSSFEPCGISLFSRHLGESLSGLGHDMVQTNVSSEATLVDAPVWVLHYAPSSFSSAGASSALQRLLEAPSRRRKLCVILHGLFGCGENRFLNDGLCPSHAEHVRWINRSADVVCTLSASVLQAYQSWPRANLHLPKVVRADHPGLFRVPALSAPLGDRYAFLGGISRPKKSHVSRETARFLELCGLQRIHIWEHWSNVKGAIPGRRSWRETYGFLGDAAWSDLLSQAHVVLFPYKTRVQSVSGIMSEALSAGRFVLSTPFEIALEMRSRFPDLVFIEDDLQCWAEIIRNLPDSARSGAVDIPTWPSFARTLADELSEEWPPGRRSLESANAEWPAFLHEGNHGQLTLTSRL